MYAIVEIAGQQFKVEKKQQIYVNRLEGKEGSKVAFSDVLLIDDNGKVNVGMPVIEGAVINAKILEHVQGDKVLVFKKKRRKGYQKLNGHRQQLTRLVIENILEKAPKTAASKAAKAESPDTSAKKADKPADKPASAKATADKKAATKTTAKSAAKSASAKATADKSATAKASGSKKASAKASASKPAAKKTTKSASEKAKAPADKKAAPKKTASKPKAASKAKKAGDDKKDKE